MRTDINKNSKKYYLGSQNKYSYKNSKLGRTSYNRQPINHKIRAIYFVVALIVSGLTAMYAIKIGLNPPMGFIYGCVGANVAVVIVSLIFRIPTHLYVLALIFVYMASPLGSIMNFYRSIDPYDKIVHFFSGILIAAFGWFIITKLLPVVDGKTKFIACMVAFLFASAGAGIWEIFEFSADKLAGGEMQRGMIDTVTDMIAGNLGGIGYSVVRAIKK